MSGTGARVIDGPTFSLPSLTLSGGSLEVRSGTLNVSGATTIDPGAMIRMTGGAYSPLGGLNNNGTFQVDSGTFNIAGSSSTVTDTSAGTFSALPGATINFATSTHNLAEGSQLAGGGTFGFTSGFLNMTGTTSGATVAAGTTLQTMGNAIGGSGVLTNLGTLDAAGSTMTLSVVNQGAFNVATASTSVTNGFTQQAGTINVAAGQTLTVGGTGLDWQGGTLQGTSAASYSLSAFTFSGSGARVLDGPTFSFSSLTVPSGSLEVRSGALTVSGATTIDSGATLQVTGGTFTPSGTFNNDGTFQLDAGTTSLAGGGIHSGSFSIASGATLAFSGGTHNLNSPASVTGTGNVTFSGANATLASGTTYSPTGTTTVSGGTVTFDGTASTGGFTQTAGTVTGSGTLTVNNSFSQSGGSQTGSGTTVLGSAITYTPGTATLDRNITVQGTLNQPAGTLTVNSGKTLTANTLNLTGGTITGAGDVAATQLGWSAGTISGSGAFTVGAGGATLTNTAAVNLNGRTLTVNGPFTQAGTFWLDMHNGATLTVNGLATLDTSNISTSFFGINSVSGAASTVNFLGGITKLGAQPYDLAVRTNTAGTVRSQQGELVFDGGFVAASTGGTHTGTSFVADPGASIKLANGTHQAAGNVTISGGGSMQLGNNDGVRVMSLDLAAGATLTNTGTLNLVPGATLTAALDNQGTLNLTGVSATGLLTNSATLNVNGTVTASGGVQQTAGTLNVPAGQTLTVGGPGLVLAGGALTGEGSITGNVNNTGGTVTPGASPGILTISGNYTQGPSGVLDMEIGGTTAGTQYDQLLVTGNASLGGTLNATLINAFVPAATDAFTLIQASGTVSGTFATTNLPAGVTLSPTYLPSTFALVPPVAAATVLASSPLADFSTEVIVAEDRSLRAAAIDLGPVDPPDEVKQQPAPICR
jgi:hypothetical protein